MTVIDTCASCGKNWIEHLGTTGTCAIVQEFKKVLEFYADANNTTRDCMSEGLVCANVELSKVAIAALERLK